MRELARMSNPHATERLHVAARASIEIRPLRAILNVALLMGRGILDSTSDRVRQEVLSSFSILWVVEADAEGEFLAHALHFMGLQH